MGSSPREDAGIFSVFSLWMANGVFNLAAEDGVNKKFPEIETLTAKKLMKQAWKGR